MNDKDKKHIGKFLSFILRHHPEVIGITLDANGWANVEELMAGCAAQDKHFSKADLEEIVATNEKKRYAFNDDHTRIRASQGHSLDVELDLLPVGPPEFLYHGTVDQFMDAIREEGLMKKSRQHVHLSRDRETAITVASRRGKPVVLAVRAGEMHRNGHLFFCSANGVWLTDHVPAKFLEINT